MKAKWVLLAVALTAVSAVVIAEINLPPDQQHLTRAFLAGGSSGCCQRDVAATVESVEKPCSSAEMATATATEGGCCAKAAQVACGDGGCESKKDQAAEACPVAGCPSQGGCDGDGLEAVLTSFPFAECAAGGCESNACPFAKTAAAETTCPAEKAACCSAEKTACSEGGCGEQCPLAAACGLAGGCSGEAAGGCCADKAGGCGAVAEAEGKDQEETDAAGGEAAAK